MERVNRILRHPLYQSLLRELREAEAERIFCGHDMEHFLAVARLAWIENLQEHSGIAREMIYAAALLQDRGADSPGVRLFRRGAGSDHKGDSFPQAGWGGRRGGNAWSASLQSGQSFTELFCL